MMYSRSNPSLPLHFEDILKGSNPALDNTFYQLPNGKFISATDRLNGVIDNTSTLYSLAMMKMDVRINFVS